MPDWFLVLTLIVLGFILLLIELLIIPGFGFVGLLGFFSLGFGSYIAYAKLSLTIGLIISFGSLIIIIFVLKIFPRTNLWKKLRLEKAETKESGFQIISEDLNKLVGKEGISITSLRPSGIALIDGKRIDVVTEGIFLSPDTKIEVVKVEGNKVTVRTK